MAATEGPWGREHLTKALIFCSVALVAAFTVVQLVRPEQLPSSPQFRTSSTYNRIILGAGGLDLFARSPIVGLGWRRSDSPAVIAQNDLGERLRQRFSTTNQTFYPDVRLESVHNTYIQVLAELGLVGMALFLGAVWAVGRSARRLISSLTGSGVPWRHARFAAFGAVLILIWLNDNPLYGGQPETILLATFVGALVAWSRESAPGARTRAGEPPVS
jgi:O-antigen ligase